MKVRILTACTICLALVLVASAWADEDQPPQPEAPPAPAESPKPPAAAAPAKAARPAVAPDPVPDAGQPIVPTPVQPLSPGRSKRAPRGVPMAPAAPPGRSVQSYGPPAGVGPSAEYEWTRHDPEMQKLGAAESEMERLTHELAEAYRRHSGRDEARQKIRQELVETVSGHFDLRQKRRQLELHRLEDQLKRLRDAIDKRTEARESIIRNRLSQLLGEEEDVGF